MKLLNFSDILMIAAVSYVAVWGIDKGLKAAGLSSFTIGG